MKVHPRMWETKRFTKEQLVFKILPRKGEELAYNPFLYMSSLSRTEVI